MDGVPIGGSSASGERRNLVRWPTSERRALEFDHNGVLLRRSRADDADRQAAAEFVLTREDRRELAAIGHPLMQRRAIASRVLLREMLSDTYDNEIGPREWVFERTPAGKPFVAHGLPQAQFSISYSGLEIVAAVSRTRRVGIDMELEHIGMNEVGLRPYLTRRERLALSLIRPDLRPQAVVRLWTLKEAYVKLCGIGLAADLDKIEFGFDPVRLSTEWEPTDRDARTQFAVWTKVGHSGPLHISLAVSPLGATHQRTV